MPAERIRAIAERTNQLNPDVIVLLGDFTASHKLKTRTVAPEEWADALSILKAPLGVHAILGNHDWWDDLHAQRTGRGPGARQARAGSVGIPVYENEWCASARTAVRSGWQDSATRWPSSAAAQGAWRRFEGVDDLPARSPRSQMRRPWFCWRTSRIFLRACPSASRSRFRDIPTVARCACSAIRRWCPRVRQPLRLRPHHRRQPHLIVSGGLGCSILPVRIGVPPEIVMVDVSAPPDHSRRLARPRRPHRRGRRRAQPHACPFVSTSRTRTSPASSITAATSAGASAAARISCGSWATTIAR